VGEAMYATVIAAMWSVALLLGVHMDSVEISLADVLWAGRVFIGIFVGFFVVTVVRSFGE